MEPDTTPSQERYAELLIWLNNTMVKVEELYVHDNPKQPIRNLFGTLSRIVYGELIKKFIIGGAGTSPTLLMDNFNAVIDEMTRMYERMPKNVVIGDSNYEQFFNGDWKKFILSLQKAYSNNEFVTYFLEKFGSGSPQDKKIYFHPQNINIKNLKTLFAEIAKIRSRPLMNLLKETYVDKQYNRWYKREGESEGGRRLSRRRKSNPKSKSKSKHKHKRRSYKKSSYRRQRH